MIGSTPSNHSANCTGFRMYSGWSVRCGLSRKSSAPSYATCWQGSKRELDPCVGINSRAFWSYLIVSEIRLPLSCHLPGSHRRVPREMGRHVSLAHHPPVDVHNIPSTELPFYKKHPIGTAVVTGIVGGTVLTGVTIAALSFVGSTSAGFTAGHLSFAPH